MKRAQARAGLMRRRPREVTLFDASARPFNATATVSAWRGSAYGRRQRGWLVNDAAINSLLSGDVAEMRRRSHDVQRKSPWADSALDSYVANCVGSGIVPRPLTDDDATRRELMEAWEEFVEQSDADGTLDFYGQQALVCRSQREGGDCFVRIRPRRPGDGLCVPLQLQVLEAELVDPSYDEPFLSNGGRIQAGIEFNGIGVRTAYHMWREHPNDMVTFRNVSRVRVPAENVLHVFEVLRAGQIRGVPGLSVGLNKLWEVEKYDDAEVMRKQIAAMFAGFVTNPDITSNPLDAGTDEGFDDDDKPLAALEPGTMQELEPGQGIVFSEPADVGSSYEPFMRAQLRQIAATADVTYEQMTGDLTGVNFSSIRAGMIEHWRRMQQRQRNIIIFQLCRPVWQRFVATSVLCGRVTLPTDPEKLRGLARVAWTPTPGREYVDPEKEVRATTARLRAGLISRSKAVAEQGFDCEALDREIAADNARADALGLRFDGDARIPQGGGGTVPSAFEVEDERENASPPPPLDEGQDENAEDVQTLAMLRYMRQLADRGALPRSR